jgi:ABC-type transporter Mla subunit MlaD
MMEQQAFDSDLMEEVDAGGADAGDTDLDAALDEGDAFDAADATDFGDSLSADAGDAFTDSADDMALWNVFEEEVADGLDAADDDEFFGRLLGGLGRAASALGRGAAGSVAGRIGSFAQQAGRVAGQVGQAAQRVSPAAQAAARLARMLGAPGAASALGNIGQFAQGVGRAAGGAQGLFGQLSQLLGQGGNAMDAFEDMADLFAEDGVDEALPAVVGLAARAAARGLGFRNLTQVSQAGRRALVRGVAAAARELIRQRGPHAVRALPRLAQAATRVAMRRARTPQQLAQAVRRGLPQAARRVAQNPQVVRRLAQPERAGKPAPLARPKSIGRGIPSAHIDGGARRYTFQGPVTLTISPARA